MKTQVLIALVAMTTGATIASAAEPAGPSREKSVMVYFAKSFGAHKRGQTPLQFGLKLQRSEVMDASQSFDLLDLQYAAGGGMTMTAAGALQLRAFGDARDDSSSSSSMPSIRQHPVITVLVVTGVIAAGLCLAQSVICEKNKHKVYEIPQSPTPTGPG